MKSNWDIKLMSEVVSWSSGGTPKASVKAYYENGHIPWLVIGDLNDGTVLISEKKITKLGLENSNAKMIPKNTLLVAMYGSIGKLGITGIECCTNQAIAFAKELYGVTTKFMYYQMKFLKPKLLSMGKGGTQKNISQTVLNSLEVVVPPIEEQNSIVLKIEELFSELDKGVEELNKVKEQLKIYRQAVLKTAFEGEFCIEKTEPQICKITEIVRKEKNSLKAGPFGTSLKKEMYVKKGYKIYGQEQVIAGDENIGDYFIDENKYNELSSCKISPNDVLISLVGTVGKVLVLSERCVPGIINPRLVKVSLDENKMIPKYFKYYFESGYLRSLYKHQVHGATMDVLNLRMIKELPFPVYPIYEQKRIIFEIEERLSVCDKIEKIINESLQQAESLRQSILKQAFEGKLV